MFLLGLLSVIQMAILPGLLVTWWLRLARDPIRGTIVVLCLSPLINAAVVTCLLAAGLYHRPVVLGLFVVQVGLLLWLARRRGTWSEHRRVLVTTLREVRGSLRPLPGWLVGLAALVVVLAAADALLQFGTIFSVGDAVNSWNRWGLEIAQNEHPTRTLYYPQLVPSVFSISYVFMGGGEVWFFAKGWIALFLPTLLLAMFQAARDSGRWEFLAGLLLTPLLLAGLLTPAYVHGGVVDVALATFAFVAVQCVMIASSSEDDRERKRLLLLGAAFAIACGLTKQGGLYVTAIYPVLGWITVRRAVAWWLFPAILLASAAVIVPWYLFMSHGSGSTHLSGLTTRLHADRDLPARLVHGARLLAGQLGTPALILAAIAVVASVGCRWCRVVTLLVAIPYTVLWCVGFSYDTRNITLAVPFLATAIACGAGVIGRTILRPLPSRDTTAGRHARTVLVIASILAAAGLVSSRMGRDELIAAHGRAAETTIGVPALNDRLLGHFRTHPGPGQVLTHYKTMRWIPALEQHWYPFWMSRGNTPNQVAKYLREPEVTYLLIDLLKTSPELREFVETGVRTGGLEIVFSMERFIFYRVIERPAPPARGGWERPVPHDWIPPDRR